MGFGNREAWSLTLSLPFTKSSANLDHRSQLGSWSALWRNQSSFPWLWWGMNGVSGPESAWPGLHEGGFRTHLLNRWRSRGLHYGLWGLCYPEWQILIGFVTKRCLFWGGLGNKRIMHWMGMVRSWPFGAQEGKEEDGIPTPRLKPLYQSGHIFSLICLWNSASSLDPGVKCCWGPSWTLCPGNGKVEQAVPSCQRLNLLIRSPTLWQAGEWPLWVHREGHLSRILPSLSARRVGSVSPLCSYSSNWQALSRSPAQPFRGRVMVSKGLGIWFQVRRPWGDLGSHGGLDDF